MPAIFNVLSGNRVRLSKLTNEESGAFVNTAVVTATLVDRDGVPVTGQVWPLALDYVIASDGVYQGVFSDSLDLTKFEIYTAQITADAGPGLHQYWECEGPAQAASC